MKVYEARPCNIHLLDEPGGGPIALQPGRQGLGQLPRRHLGLARKRHSDVGGEIPVFAVPRNLDLDDGHGYAADLAVAHRAFQRVLYSLSNALLCQSGLPYSVIRLAADSGQKSGQQSQKNGTRHPATRTTASARRSVAARPAPI